MNPTDGDNLMYLDLILRLLEEAGVPSDTRERILQLIDCHARQLTDENGKS